MTTMTTAASSEPMRRDATRSEFPLRVGYGSATTVPDARAAGAAQSVRSWRRTMVPRPGGDGAPKGIRTPDLHLERVAS